MGTKLFLSFLAFAFSQSLCAEPLSFSLGPHSSPVLTELLAQSNAFLPESHQWTGSELVVQGYDLAHPPTLTSADCRAKAERPAYGSPEITDPGNEIRCTFVDSDGKSGTVLLTLKSTPIQAAVKFGPGLQFDFEDVVARKLFFTLGYAKKTFPSLPMVDREVIWGPDGVKGLQWFDVKAKPADDYTTVSCTRRLTRDQGDAPFCNVKAYQPQSYR